MGEPFVKFIKDFMYWGAERFGKYYSSYRAFVYRRDDPEGLGRLQLYVPHVFGVQPYKYWAHPLGMYSGKGYGIKFIPQVGDMVMVEFEAGNPRIPLWKHGHPIIDKDMGSNIPPELRDPDIYYIRTPKGLGFIFNDKTMEIKIIGASIENESVEHTLTVGNNTIQVTDTGVNITVGQGSKVYVNGGNPVLYAKVPMAKEILDLSEIGISNAVRVGG